MARKPVPRPDKNPITQMVGEDHLTTMIVGEEDHGISTLIAGEETVFTTLIVGEEGHGYPTHLLGEHGGGLPPTHLLGEHGGGIHTTPLLGEEGGRPPITQRVGEQGPTTKAIGEEATQMAGEDRPPPKRRAKKRSAKKAG